MNTADTFMQWGKDHSRAVSTEVLSGPCSMVSSWWFSELLHCPITTRDCTDSQAGGMCSDVGTTGVSKNLDTVSSHRGFSGLRHEESPEPLWYYVCSLCLLYPQSEEEM